MSMGFLVPTDAPVIWRGPMLHQALRQLLRDVMWGTLDYLIVDLPPGTGDVQLTLTQSLPLAGAVMVTTPQDVALADVLKGAEMFRQLDVPVLGLIENMSYFLCPHCGRPEAIFGEGGGERLCQKLGTTLLAQVPLDPAVRSGGDSGQPIVLDDRSQAGLALRQAAKLIAEKVAALQAPPQRARSAPFVPDAELRIVNQ
jgi:ATP-binding protein involved in chromosome partitioning